jgi:murein biosynthesis integral membrane protein MurJ
MDDAARPNQLQARLIARISAVHSNHRRIAAGALLIGILTLVAKLFVAGREMAIAWRYGVSATVDAYQLSVTATTWLPNMLTGVMAVVLVPRLVKLERDAGEGKSFIAELNGSVLILALVVAVVTWAAAPAAAALLASNMDWRTAELTSTMTGRMAPVSFFMIVAGYLFARLQSRERFGYTVTEAVPALAIVLFIVSPLGLIGPTALIEGTVVGYLLQLLVLGFLVMRADAPIGRVRLRHHSDEWLSLYGSLILMVSGQLLMTASIPIDQGFAARIGKGAVASLGYANRIVTLFSGIGTIVVGRSLLPVLSRSVADGDFALGRRQALQWSFLLAAVATVGSAATWLVAPQVVRLLFERGAFDAAATASVASALRWGVLQLPFYFAGIALVQWYAATGRYRSILGITVCALTVKLAGNLVLTPQFGVSGIMMSTAIMYLVTATLLFSLALRLSSTAKLSAPKLGD